MLRRNRSEDVQLDGPQGVDYASLATGERGAERLSAMPQPRRFVPAKPPIGQRRCPACGLPLVLSHVAISNDADCDERTFECAACAYAETIAVNFRD
jgi:hypothetical protein